MIAAGFTIAIGGAFVAATSHAATRPPAAAPTPPTAVDTAQTAMDRAAATALAKVPGGTVKKSETECEDGHLVYSFDIASTTGVVKVSVDAATGVATAKADDDDDKSEGSVEKGKKAHHEEAEDDEDDDDDGGCTTSPHAAKTLRK
jgi:hypothetical protein